MEDIFKSATECVLTQRAEDVALFHKHVSPGHRVSSKGHILTLMHHLAAALPGFVHLHIFAIVSMHSQDSVDDWLRKNFPV